MQKKTMLAGVLALGLLATGCQGKAGTDTAAPQTLTIAASDALEGLDPAVAFVGWSTSRNGMTEPLIDVDEKLNLVPKLATEWKSTSPTTWEITLRDGVKFSNGTPMDAAAVKKSLEHARDTNVRAKSQLALKAITTKDNKVVIETEHPLGALPHVLTDPMLNIQALGEGINPAKAPVGTGPYKVSEFTPLQKLSLVPNEHYWNGKPALAGVTVKDYSDAQAMGLAVQTGEADVVLRPNAATLKTYADTSRFTVWKNTGTRSDAAILNTSREVFKDVRARKAINAALDRSGYEALMTGMAQPAYAYFPSNVSFGGTDGLKPAVDKKDLALAKQLFMELGYKDENGKLVKDGQPLTLKLLTYTRRPYLGQMAQLLQNDLKSIGVELTITELKSSEEAMKAGDFDIAMYSMVTAPTGDPEYFFDTMLRSTAGNNYGRYASPAFDAALNKLSTATTDKDRAEAARAAQQILLDDQPYLVFGNQDWWAVSSASVKNLELRPTDYHLVSVKTSVAK